MMVEVVVVEVVVVVVVVLAEKASAILSKGWTFGEGIRVLWCRSNGSKVALDVAWETPPAGVRSPRYCFRHHRWWCRKTRKTLRDSKRDQKGGMHPMVEERGEEQASD